MCRKEGHQQISSALFIIQLNDFPACGYNKKLSETTRCSVSFENFLNLTLNDTQRWGLDSQDWILSHDFVCELPVKICDLT